MLLSCVYVCLCECVCLKSYELIKTEEIPNLDNSGFSPRVIKDVAQNILSFLKAKATKEGHTYWLFRGCKPCFLYKKEMMFYCFQPFVCGSLVDEMGLFGEHWRNFD